MFQMNGSDTVITEVTSRVTIEQIDAPQCIRIIIKS